MSPRPEPLPEARNGDGGQRVTVTHPDKLLFPDDGVSKRVVVDYYRRIASRMLPQVRGRPLHMQRFPNGIRGIAIEQKRVPDSFPEWITRATVARHSGGTITHVVIDSADTLAYLANYNMISAHVWLSRVEAPDTPDQLIFDLDPADDDFTLVRATALDLKALLEERGFVPFVKTTGSRGLHIVTPIIPGPDFDEAHRYADQVAQALARSNPARLTTEFIKQRRDGRLFIDVNRNAYAQTAAAPYSLRARRGAPIAMPVAWADLRQGSLRPDGVTIGDVWTWIRDHDDPWADMDGARRAIPDGGDLEPPDRSGRRRGLSRAERERAV